LDSKLHISTFKRKCNTEIYLSGSLKIERREIRRLATEEGLNIKNLRGIIFL